MKTYVHTFCTSGELTKFLLSVEKMGKYTTLISYFSGVLDIDYNKKIIQQILEVFPRASLVGSTTDGEISNGVVLNNSVVICLIFFEYTNISIHVDIKSSTSYKMGEKLGKIATYNQAKLALLMTNSININGEQFITGFTSEASNVIIAGGMAGDNRKFKKTYLFVNDSIYTDSAVAVFFTGEKLRIFANHSNNWIGVGPKMIITKSVGNRIYKIDNESVRIIYEKYLGQNIVNENGFNGMEFPLIYDNEKLQITRVPLQIYDDGSFLFSGDIINGTIVQFALADIGDLLKQSRALHQEIALFQPEVILVFSCMARKTFLGDFKDIETKYLPAIAPTAGFFTYGEFFHNILTKENFFLSDTFTSLSLSENPISAHILGSSNSDFIEYNSTPYPFLDTYKVLNNIIKTTSCELNKVKNDINKAINEEKERRKEAQNFFYAQSRLSTMGEITDMLAHQWRQPLMAMNSIISLMRIKLKLNSLFGSNLEEYTSDLEKQIYLLSNIINQFSYISNTSKKPVNSTFYEISEIIKCNLNEYVVSVGIKLNLIIACEVDLYIFKNELIQVIIVAVQNAIDVIIERKILGGEIVIYFDIIRGTNKCYIVIQDNGGGIIKENIDKIFNPYFTTKHQKNGAGLGLFIAKTIVERQLLGIISVENNYDGACFRLEFPLNIMTEQN